MLVRLHSGGIPHESPSYRCCALFGCRQNSKCIFPRHILVWCPDWIERSDLGVWCSHWMLVYFDFLHAFRTKQKEKCLELVFVSLLDLLYLLIHCSIKTLTMCQIKKKPFSFLTLLTAFTQESPVFHVSFSILRTSPAGKLPPRN